MSDSIYKYFKVGDIVLNVKIWGNKKFVIDKMYGNEYMPIIDVHPIGKIKTNSNTCLFNISMIKLVNARKRPLARLKRDILLKMMRRGNEEAKREFIIRVHNKKF